MTTETPTREPDMFGYLCPDPAEFRALVDAIGITQVAAAGHMAVHDRTVRKWIKGEREGPPFAHLHLLLYRALRIHVLEPTWRAQVQTALLNRERTRPGA